jgi:hypothetical protein
MVTVMLVNVSCHSHSNTSMRMKYQIGKRHGGGFKGGVRFGGKFSFGLSIQQYSLRHEWSQMPYSQQATTNSPVACAHLVCERSVPSTLQFCRIQNHVAAAPLRPNAQKQTAGLGRPRLTRYIFCVVHGAAIDLCDHIAWSQSRREGG